MQKFKLRENFNDPGHAHERTWYCYRRKRFVLRSTPFMRIRSGAAWLKATSIGSGRALARFTQKAILRF
ncbi:MAG: hypothetical protein KIT74_00090 [Fimbriimonadales bacterium]|nr:hypothetical protein [Fimbriimonadales bacterium]